MLARAVVGLVLLAAACGGQRVRDSSPLQNEASDGRSPSDGRPIDGACQPASGGFSARFGDAARQYVTELALGSDQIVLTGFFDGTLDFGAKPLEGLGGWDLFVARFSNSGEPLSSWRIGSSGSEHGSAVAVDQDGNVAVAGGLTQAVDFGQGPAGGHGQAFVASYGSNDQLRWVRFFPEATFVSVAALPDGSVIAAGALGVGTTTAFVVRISAAGTKLWERVFEDDGAGAVHDVATTESGNVVVVGIFKGTLTFAPTQTLEAMEPGAFAAELDTSGAVVWYRLLSAEDTVYGLQLALGPETIAISGVPEHSTPDGLSHRGGYVALLNGDGSDRWVKSSPAFDGYEELHGLSVSTTGVVLVSAYFEDTVTMFGTQQTSAGEGDIALLSFTPSGVLTSIRQYGDASYQSAQNPAFLPNGNFVLGGAFEGTVDFDGCPLSSAGDCDVILVSGVP